MNQRAGDQRAWDAYAAHMRRAEQNRALAVCPVWNAQAQALRVRFQREFGQ